MANSHSEKVTVRTPTFPGTTSPGHVLKGARPTSVVPSVQGVNKDRMPVTAGDYLICNAWCRAC
jgi:hypothetical protein